MLKNQIAEDGKLAWYVFGRDLEKSEQVIDTNEYLIVGSNEAMILDPGGTEIFPQVVSGLSQVLNISQITAFFASHQDPDIMSSLPLWMGLCPKAKIYMSWIWTSFIAHFGHEYVNQFHALPDDGMILEFGGGQLQFIPAHYCHSSGNFSVFDPSNKILFSGDIGAALLPPDVTELYVTHFQEHIQYMETFHRRWMPSNRAKNDWVRRVRKLEPMYICPQHGSIFKGKDVVRFLDWFEGLEVGNAI